MPELFFKELKKKKKIPLSKETERMPQKRARVYISRHLSHNVVLAAFLMDEFGDNWRSQGAFCFTLKYFLPLMEMIMAASGLGLLCEGFLCRLGWPEGERLRQLNEVGDIKKSYGLTGEDSYNSYNCVFAHCLKVWWGVPRDDTLIVWYCCLYCDWWHDLHALSDSLDAPLVFHTGTKGSGLDRVFLVGLL